MDLVKFGSKEANRPRMHPSGLNGPLIQQQPLLLKLEPHLGFLALVYFLSETKELWRLLA